MKFSHRIALVTACHWIAGSKLSLRCWNAYRSTEDDNNTDQLLGVPITGDGEQGTVTVMCFSPLESAEDNRQLLACGDAESVVSIHMVSWASSAGSSAASPPVPKIEHSLDPMSSEISATGFQSPVNEPHNHLVIF